MPGIAIVLSSFQPQKNDLENLLPNLLNADKVPE
jgi:hypothetical protein